MAYRSIDLRTWTDPKFVRLSARAKLVFLYLITNRHSHMCGLYHFIPEVGQIETGIGPTEWGGAMKELVEAGMIEYDNENMLVYVKKMAQHQMSNDSCWVGASRHVDAIAECEIKQEFIRNNGHRLDRVSTGCRQGADRVVAPTPDQDQDQKQKQKQETHDQSSIDRASVKSEYSSGFLEFWRAYPRKVGKGAAWRAWRTSRPDTDAVLAALKWQAASESWAKEGGRYIPHPATYLNQRRWEDEPVGASQPAQQKPKNGTIYNPGTGACKDAKDYSLFVCGIHKDVLLKMAAGKIKMADERERDALEMAKTRHPEWFNEI